MRKIKKRCITLLLSAAILAASTVRCAAAVLPDQYRQPFLQSAASRISALQTAYTDNVAGQYGLLYKLEILGEYAMYLNYLATYKEELNLLDTMQGMDSEIDYYASDLVDKIVAFDAVYSRDSSRYLKVEIGIRSRMMKSSTDVAEQTGKLCSEIIPDYLGSLLKKVQKNSKEAKRTELFGSHGVLLSHVYSCMSDLYEVVEDITNISPFTDDSCTEHVSFNSIIKVRSKLDKLGSRYRKLLDVGEEVADILGQDSVVTIDPEKSFLENMANVTENDSGDVTVPEDVKLSLAYLAILAASSVYTPLESYVGDSVFKAALKSLVTDESAVSLLVNFYDDTKDYRKPLYKRDINTSGNPTGKAELITVSEFFDDIMDGSIGALVTVQGKFLYDTSRNYWVYSDTYKTTDDDGITNASFTDEGYNENEGDTLASAEGSTIVDDDEGGEGGEESKKNKGSEGSKGKYKESSNDIDSTGSLTDLEESVQGMQGKKTGLSSIEKFFGSIEAHAVQIDPAASQPQDPSKPTASVPVQTEIDDGETGDSAAADDSTVSVTTVESSNTQTVGGMGTGEIVEASVLADAVVTSEDKMSEPVLLYGTKYSRSVDNLTSMILRNMLLGTVNYQNAAPDSNDYLYINAYGDIVTDENLVILPGAANPIIYGADQKYNPFTVAFMNYYPAILRNTNHFQVSSEGDIGKFMIFDSDNSEKGINNAATEIVTKHEIKDTAPIKIPELCTEFKYNSIEKEEVFKYQRLIFGDAGKWKEDGAKMYQYTPFVISNQLNNAGISVFPYVADEDANPTVDSTTVAVDPFSVAEIIAQNVYEYFAVSDSGSSKNQAKLSDNYLVYYFAVSNLNGTNNPSAFASNDVFAYDRYMSDSVTRQEKTVLLWSRKLLGSFLSADGVIGIKNSYQGEILGPLFASIKSNIAFVAAAVMIILMYAFLRIRRDAFQVLVLLSVSLAFSYAFIYVLPVYVPMVYNSIVNSLAENLTYEILGTRTEYNDAGGGSVNNVDDAGNYVMNTSSITLYRVATWDQKKLYDSAGVKESSVVGGSTHVMNQESGLFIEGDSLKVNSDILFDTLKIKGSIDEASLQYHLASYKTVSNNVDYYVPYYKMVDSFINNVNKLSDAYSIPRRTSKYMNGRNKDNYLVYSFVNSEPFLTPGQYGPWLPADQSSMTDEEKEYYTENSKELQEALSSAFGDENQAYDWLGVSSFLYSLSDEEQKTIWANTLKDNGYYDAEWNPVVSKMDKLVTYINYHTKKFVFSMDSQIGSLSDDVMIKMICLRALVAFTQYGSEFGHWMYPFSLNYEELSIGDILNCIFTDNYKVFIANDMDICEYILYTHGMLHLIVFDCAALLMFLVSSAINLLNQFMYLLLGVLLAAKIVTGGDIKVPIKGYLKCTFIVMACSTMLCGGIIAVRLLNGAVLGFYAALFLLLFIVYLLFSIVTAIVFNLTEFGNTEINSRITAVSSNLQLGRREMFVRSANISCGRNRKMYADGNVTRDMSRYRRGSSVDSMYAEHRGRHSWINDRRL